MARLQQRLFAPVLVLLLAMVVMVGYAIYEASTRAAVVRAQVDDVQRASELVVRLNAMRREVQVGVLRYIPTRDPRLVAYLEQLTADTNEAVAELGRLHPSPEHARLYQLFAAARRKDLQARLQLFSAVRDGDPRKIELASRRWDLARLRVDALLADVSGYNLNQLQQTLRDLERRRSTALALLGLAVALSIGVVMIYASIVARTVVRPIAELTDAAAGLPGTSFDPPRDAMQREDEIGVLARTLSRVMDEMRASHDRLLEADRRKDEFLSILSHELRNPLAPIRNGIYLLNNSDPASDTARRARRVIQRQTEHLTRIVDDLLDVTRIARGKIDVRRERVDLTQLVRRTAEDHRALLASRDVQLSVSLPDSSIWIDADATRISQVVGNLLQNAGKFTPEGGEVLLSLSAGPASAEISVRDTGVGIEPELLGQIFEPFVQSERSLARTQGGLGLGLALAKGLVELHGGTIVATSRGPHEGAEFTVTLPLATAASEEPPAAEPTVPVVTRSRRVLVVDDNRDAADSLAELVRVLGHRADVTYDGPTAVERASRAAYDLILCDIGLPGMSGYEVAKLLRARLGPATHLVAVSGYAQPEDLARAEEAGFHGHVAKPPDPRKLERLLDVGDPPSDRRRRG